jgi:uncharacterized membrane protein
VGLANPINPQNEIIISIRWSTITARSSSRFLLLEIPDRHVRDDCNARQNEVVRAHYAGAIILIAAAAAFLVLVFVLDRAFDFSRLAY